MCVRVCVCVWLSCSKVLQIDDHFDEDPQVCIQAYISNLFLSRAIRFERFYRHMSNSVKLGRTEYGNIYITVQKSWDNFIFNVQQLSSVTT